MATDVCFPRGKTKADRASIKLLDTGSGSAPYNKITEKVINKKTIVKPRKVKSFDKRPSKKNVVKKSSENFGKSLDNAITSLPQRLATKKVTEGTLILGAIKDVRDYEVRLNLPNNVTGVVSITNMAECYTGLLKSFAQSSDDQNMVDELSSLSELFTVGQIVACSCIGDAKENNVVPLSMNPKLINGKLTPAHLITDFILYGVIAGIEDHGCSIDFGVANISAFMATTMKTDLRVGMMRRFKIIKSELLKMMSGECRTVNVVLHTDEDKNEPALQTKDIQFNSVVPGLLVEGKIFSRKPEGLTVSLGPLTAYIHVTHLRKHVKEYKSGCFSKFRVLAINPTTKYIHLTDLPSLVDGIDKPGEGPILLPLGEPLDVQIVKVVDKQVFISSSDGHVTYIGKSLLPDKVIQSAKKKPNEIKTKCFWFGWDYLEGRPVFTTSQIKVARSVLPTLKAGDSVCCKITKVSNIGAKVKLKNGLHAFIQNIHLTEVPLKQPEKKFKIGDQLNCRVLNVDMKKKRVRLTAKPSLVNSLIPVVDDLNMLAVGALVQGVIVKLTSGALISFYNGVLGFVPASCLAKEPISSPSEAFYIGQSVQCRVVSCDPEANRLALTFILDGDVYTQPRPPKRKLENSGEHTTDNLQGEYSGTTKKKRLVDEEILPGKPLKIGEVIRAWSVEKRIPNGFVVFSGEGHRALLPTSHLSDYPALSHLLSETVKSGDILPDLVCISSNQTPNVVSNKFLFKHYAAKNGLASSWQSLKVGDKYPGSVMSHTEFGIFVNLGNGMVGLCPLTALPKGSDNDPARFLPAGRTVLTKVVSVDLEKERALLTLNEPEVALPRSDDCIMSLCVKQYLDETKRYLICKDINHPITKYRIGQVVQGQVTSQGEDFVHLLLDDGLVATASGSLAIGCNASRNKVLQAVVVYIDVINLKLHVLVDKKYVEERKKMQMQKVSCQVKVGQTVKSDVIYSCPDYILCMLKAHAYGKLAFLSPYKHPNSVVNENGFYYGQENRVTITICNEDDDNVIGVLQTELERKLSKAEKLHQAQDLPAVGSVLDATVSSKSPLQLNLKVGKAAGRVFITELQDQPIPGTCPLQHYSIGKSLRVKVIGLKLIVDKSRAKKSLKDSGESVLLDCSLRESALSGMSMPSPVDITVGAAYCCFVTGHELHTARTKVIKVITAHMKPGTISLTDLGAASSSAENIVSKFPIGLCLKATVVSVANNGSAIMKPLSAKEHDEAEEYDACVIMYDEAKGLIVSTRIGPKCTIPHCELKDIPYPVVGLHIKCYLAKKTRHGGAIMTLKKPSIKEKFDDESETEIKKSYTEVVGAIEDGKMHLENGQSRKRTSRLSKRFHNDNLEYQQPSKQLTVNTNEHQQQTVIMSEDVGVCKTEDSGADVEKVDVVVERDEETGTDIVFKKRKTTGKTALDFSISLHDLDGDPLLSADVEKVGENPQKTLKGEKFDQQTDNGAKAKISQYNANITENEQELLAALKTSPDNGRLWSKLISITVQYKGIESARMRCEQALQAISYRMEDEKLLVWAEFFRVELIYGTSDSFNDIRRRALQQMDEQRVYHELIKVYKSQNMTQEVEQCFSIMLRKWQEKPQIWIDFGQFYFEDGKLESARSILQKALKALPAKSHIEVIMKFAQFELKHNQYDRFVSLFESILGNFPKRLDVWLVYTDQLIKSSRYDSARSVFRRVLLQKLNIKKRELFTKKYLEFENCHGDEVSVKEAKELVVNLT